ncbi:hypothetical protein TWF694_009191 [Orbilia ellipsospora]|uniref:Uncharacterized protein n=1 Tax=Orbilia ellipsospora TaxID=2528407 RepID=A0AAV9XE87_9PEZI
MISESWVFSTLFWISTILCIKLVPTAGFVIPPNSTSLDCDKLLNFRDAAADFLENSTAQSTQYSGFEWDVRWRPYTCPQIFPYLACFLPSPATKPSSCLDRTICSYNPSALSLLQTNLTLPIALAVGLNLGVPQTYTPRSLFYRSDQNLVYDNRTKRSVAPRYRFNSLGAQSFAIYSITFAWAWRDPSARGIHDDGGLAGYRAKAIVIRGFGNGEDESNGPKDIVVLNITQPSDPSSMTGSTMYTSVRSSVLPQTPTIDLSVPVRTFYPAPDILGGQAGIADPYVVFRYEFPHGNPFTQWSNLVTLEVSGYRDLVGLDGQSEVGFGGRQVPYPGEFFLKEVNITGTKHTGGCATEEEAV